MGFWIKACGFFFVCGILSMLFGTADEIFDLGIWNGEYPTGQRDEAGERDPGTYGEFMLLAGGIALVALLLGSFLWRRRVRRYEEALLFLESVKAQQECEPDESGVTPEEEGPAATLAELEAKYGADRRPED